MSGLIGQTLKGTKFKIKKKKLVAFAESIGATQPEFFGDDPIAHPAYANAYVFPALGGAGSAKNADGSGIITNPLAILHGGQVYTFPKGAPPLKDGDKVETVPSIKSIEVKSNGMLVMALEAVSKVVASSDESKVGKTVCISEIGVVCQKGGFNLQD